MLKKKMNLEKQANNNDSYLSEIQSVFWVKSSDGQQSKNDKSTNLIKYQEIDYSTEELYKITNSEVKLSQIIMDSKIKEEIDWLIDEFKNQEVLNNFWLMPDNKILLYGPSWCWKTLLAYAIANKLNKKLFIVNLSTIVDSSLWKTSNKIFQVFQTASLHKWILFFDEIDMLWKKRDDQNDHWEMKRVATSILQALDFLDKDTLFIAATNFPELVDNAILRRFNKKIKFQLPTKSQLVKFLKIILNEVRLEVNDSKIIDVIASDYLWISFAEARDKFITKIKKYIIKHKNVRIIDTDFK